MEIKMLLEGKPFMTEFGIVGYSSVVLIRTEDGKNILYDCGSKGCALQLKEALQQAGLTPTQISHLVISHLHFDHVGNLPLFSNAEVLLSEAEWKIAREDPDEWHSIPTLSYLEKRGKIQLVKEGDEIAPGVSVMELPGHTLGLIGLRCGADIILCSDALKNRYEAWTDIPLMSQDLGKSRQSIQRIKENARYIYPGHDGILDLLYPNFEEHPECCIRYADGYEVICP